MGVVTVEDFNSQWTGEVADPIRQLVVEIFQESMWTDESKGVDTRGNIGRCGVVISVAVIPNLLGVPSHGYRRKESEDGHEMDGRLASGLERVRLAMRGMESDEVMRNQ